MLLNYTVLGLSSLLLLKMWEPREFLYFVIDFIGCCGIHTLSRSHLAQHYFHNTYESLRFTLSKKVRGQITTCVSFTRFALYEFIFSLLASWQCTSVMSFMELLTRSVRSVHISFQRSIVCLGRVVQRTMTRFPSCSPAFTIPVGLSVCLPVPLSFSVCHFVCVFMCEYLSACLFNCLFVFFLFVCLCVSICLYVCLSVCIFILWSVCLLINVSVHFFLFVRSVCLSFFGLSVYLFAGRSNRPI